MGVVIVVNFLVGIAIKNTTEEQRPGISFLFPQQIGIYYKGEARQSHLQMV